MDEETFGESVEKYLKMMGEFQPGKDLLGTSLGDLENLLTGGGGIEDSGTSDAAAEVAKRPEGSL